MPLTRLIEEARSLVEYEVQPAWAKMVNHRVPAVGMFAEMLVGSWAKGWAKGSSGKEPFVALWDAMAKAPGDEKAAKAALKTLDFKSGLERTITQLAKKMKGGQLPSGAAILKAAKAEELYRKKNPKPRDARSGPRGSF